MSNKNEVINLQLEIIRLKSICLAAAYELEHYNDNNPDIPVSSELLSALKQRIYKDYISEYPHLDLEKDELINKLTCN